MNEFLEKLKSEHSHESGDTLQQYNPSNAVTPELSKDNNLSVSMKANLGSVSMSQKSNSSNARQNRVIPLHLAYLDGEDSVVERQGKLGNNLSRNENDECPCEWGWSCCFDVVLYSTL